MTNITIQGDGWTYRLTAVGHATGRPEVCAAVSAVVYALGGYLKNLEAAGAVTLGNFLLESGAAELEADGWDQRTPRGTPSVWPLWAFCRSPRNTRSW